MKNTIFTLASIATLVGSAQAQYLDNLEVSGPPVDASTTAPTGVTTTIFGWTDATLGKVTATYAGALLRGASDSYISTSADGSGRFGFYDIAIQGSSTSDKVLTFQFQNAVTQFDLSIGDWDGGGTGEVLSFGGISTASILSVGNDVGTAVYKDNGDNTITYATTNSSGGNEADGNGLRISLTNGGVAFNSFSISLDNAGSTGGSTDFIYVGGPTPVVPEPSSTALLGLGALGLLVRRKR